MLHQYFRVADDQHPLVWLEHRLQARLHLVCDMDCPVFRQQFRQFAVGILQHLLDEAKQDVRQNLDEPNLGAVPTSADEDHRFRQFLPPLLHVEEVAAMHQMVDVLQADAELVVGVFQMDYYLGAALEDEESMMAPMAR